MNCTNTSRIRNVPLQDVRRHRSRYHFADQSGKAQIIVAFCSLQVPAAATACQNAGITMITVAADITMQNSAEMVSIASPPYQRNMFVTPTLSTVLNATNGVIAALCYGRISSHLTSSITHSFFIYESYRPTDNNHAGHID